MNGWQRHGAQIAAGGIILVAVAACAGMGGAPGTSAAKPLTCKQQYQAWRTGSANAPGKKVEADAAAVSAAGKSEDIPVMTSDLKTLGADAAALAAYPMPQCADPAGYWMQYLTAVKSAGDNAGTANGLGGLILAVAPLKQVPAIQAKLTAELAKTAGVKAS